MSRLSPQPLFPLGPVLPQPWWAKPSLRKSLCSGVSTRVGVKHCSDFSLPNQKSVELIREKKDKNKNIEMLSVAFGIFWVCCGVFGLFCRILLRRPKILSTSHRVIE